MPTQEMPPDPFLDASLRGRTYPFFALAPLLLLIAGAWHHLGQLGIPFWRVPVIVLSFVWLVVMFVAAHFNVPSTADVPAGLTTHVIIPSRNEDSAMLRAMLDSLAAQTMRPNFVTFVENGETNGDAEEVFSGWAAAHPKILTRFMHLPNPGKREAQIWAIRNVAHCDITITIDGDTQLAPTAIENGLRPFANAKVMSVAGLLVGLNRKSNLLTRIIDLGFVSSFMNGRAAWSRFGSVAVNCGGLAFYRTSAIWPHLDEYVTQTITGRKVSSGDDRVLTNLAGLHGRTVLQENSVGFTLLPENLSHLTRQRARWWRSFWWGGLWLIRRASPRQGMWWLVLSQYITFLMYAVIFPLVLVVDPIMSMKFPWFFFVYIGLLSYVRTARTLLVKRTDQSTIRQIACYLVLSPVVTLTNLWLCTVLQWWGMLTFRSTGWGTRQKVEVGLSPADKR